MKLYVLQTLVSDYYYYVLLMSLTKIQIQE